MKFNCLLLLIVLAAFLSCTEESPKNKNVGTQNQKVNADFNFTKNNGNLSLIASLDSNQVLIWQCVWQIKNANSIIVHTGNQCNDQYGLNAEGTYSIELTIQRYDGSDASTIIKEVIVSGTDFNSDPNNLLADFTSVKNNGVLNLVADIQPSQANDWQCSWELKGTNGAIVFTGHSCQASYTLQQIDTYTVQLTIHKNNDTYTNSKTKTVTVIASDLNLVTPPIVTFQEKLDKAVNIVESDCAAVCHGLTPISNNAFSMGTRSSVDIEMGVLNYLSDNQNEEEQRLKQKPTDSYSVVHGGAKRFEVNSQKSIDWNAFIDAVIEKGLNTNPAIDPVAKFTLQINEKTVQFDATASVLGSTNAHTYSWMIKDGSQVVNKTGVMIEYTFNMAGQHQVVLEVQDSVSLKKGVDTQNVMIIDTAPVATGCTQTNLIFCDDFEDGIDSQLSGNAGVVDTTTGYKSSQSLKVNGESGFMSIPAPASNDYWTRVFVKSTSSSNSYDQGFAKGHGTYVKSTYQTQNANYELRVGDHRCQLELNRDDDVQNNGHSNNQGADNGSGKKLYMGDDLEMTSGAYGDDAICDNGRTEGARMKPDHWYCLEVHFNGQDSEFQVFWDNQNVQSLHVSKERTWTNSDKAPFSVTNSNDPNKTPNSAYSYHSDKEWGPYKFGQIEFGYTNYGENVNKTTWFDNFAVAQDRIGCDDNYVINDMLDSSTWLDQEDNCYPYSGDATCGEGLIEPPPPSSVDPRGHEGVLFGGKTEAQRNIENTKIVNASGKTKIEAEDFVTQRYGNNDYRGARWFMVQTKDQEVSTLPEFAARCDMAVQELRELNDSNIKYGGSTVRQIIADMWGNNQVTTFWDPITDGTGRENGAGVGVTKMVEQWACNPVVNHAGNGFNYAQAMDQASGHSVVSLLPDILYNNHNEAPHGASNWSGSGSKAPKVYYKLDLPRAGKYEVVIRTYRHGTDSGSGHWGHAEKPGQNEQMSSGRGINISGSGWKNWTVEFNSSKAGEYYFILAGREDGFMYDYFEITPK